MILTPEHILTKSPVAGFKLLTVTTEKLPESDHRSYRVVARNGDTVKDLILWIPEDSDGIFEVNATYKVIPTFGIPNGEFIRTNNAIGEIYTRSPEEILGDIFERALEIAFTNNGTGQDRAQIEIDKWFSGSQDLLAVDPDKPLSMSFGRSSVRLAIDQSGIDYQDRIPNAFDGRLDPLTTPDGDKVGLVYRLAQGATIQHRRIVPDYDEGSIFNEDLRQCILFPENNRPYRLQKIRSSTEQSERLAFPEEPILAHVDYSGQLSGTHLRTAIMGDQYNYFDTITVSESAAAKLACWRYKRLVVTDLAPIEVLVTIGDVVNPGDEVARLSTTTNVLTIHDDESGEVLYQKELADPVIKATNIRRPSTVTDISEVSTRIAGHAGWKVRITLAAIYNLEEGSKLINRHGSKGLAIIRPDKDFPYDNEGNRAELLVHPRSIAARRSFGMLKEMAVSEIVWPNATRVEHFDDTFYPMDELAKLPQGQSQTMYTGKPFARVPLEHPVFMGRCLWMRLDKHPVETMSAMNGEKPLTQHGRNPDAGKLSGQKMNTGLMTVLLAKGAKKFVHSMAKTNVEKSAVDLFDLLQFCVE